MGTASNMKAYYCIPFLRDPKDNAKENVRKRK
jgi:hypothetical protein